MNLRINFHNLTDEEKQLIFDFEDENSDQVLTKEISHSFDGSTVLQILLENSGNYAIALATVLAAIIAVRGKKTPDKPADAPAELPAPGQDGVIHVDIHTSDELLYLWNALQNAGNKMKVEDNGPDNK